MKRKRGREEKENVNGDDELNPSSRVNELKSPPRVEILPHWKVNENVRTTEGSVALIL